MWICNHSVLGGKNKWPLIICTHYITFLEWNNLMLNVPSCFYKKWPEMRSVLSALTWDPMEGSDVIGSIYWVLNFWSISLLCLPLIWAQWSDVVPNPLTVRTAAAPRRFCGVSPAWSTGRSGASPLGCSRAQRAAAWTRGTVAAAPGPVAARGTACGRSSDARCAQTCQRDKGSEDETQDHRDPQCASICTPLAMLYGRLYCVVRISTGYL